MRIDRLRPALVTGEDQLVQVGKAVHDELKSVFEKRLESLEAMVALRVADMIRREIDLRVDDLRKLLEDRMEALRRGYGESLTTIEQLVRTLPTPVVNVDVPGQAAPLVTVNVPEQPVPVVNFNPTVNVPETETRIFAPVTVNMPEVRPEVTVTVPEQSAPVVTVKIPPARLGRKTIEYDPYGRPVSVEEHDVPNPQEPHAPPESD